MVESLSGVMAFFRCKNVRICISIYCQITAKWFCIASLSIQHLFLWSVSIQLSSRLCLRLCKNYVTLVAMQALFSFWIIRIANRRVTFVFLPDLVTPQIVSSFIFFVALSLLLLLLYLYLNVCIYYLFSVESHLHIFTSKYSSSWKID